ncbi:MAG: NAD(P)/FAD-dependent oxidoreductase [Bdellovibrionaceae bacterium]|nr:NAD(P)/FAD-dependent oxidoreductase [Pseudobdellovibrionaceae bacterium]
MRLRHPSQRNGKRLVIIAGGGFGGLAAAQTLSDRPDLQVLLIDQRNHHLFQPLLYQVATGGLNPSDIAVPIRAEFSSVENVEVHLGTIDSVNLQEKYISDRAGLELSYDYLILACGAQHSYFGHPEWEEFAPGLKTVEQATEIRRRIFSAFELAENELDPMKQEAMLTFVVIGGGPTGVEMAGAIADISRTVLVKDFKRINPASARVLLVEAGPRILAQFADVLSARALKDLASLGVEVRLFSKVESITAEGVQIGSEFMLTTSVFWAAGVQAAKLQFTPELKLDRARRVVVNSDFTVGDFKHTYVIGDMASYDMGEGKLLPGLAPAAMQSGRFVARVILAEVSGTDRGEFIYLDKGQMATIGKRKAITEYKSLRLHGFIAWMAWFFIHILYLVGFKNKIFVFTQWIWSYLFSKRGARLITERSWKLK